MAWIAGGWCRRKSHTINSQAGAGTNYQIPIKVYKGAGADGTEAYHDVTMGKVYCGGNCQNDFGDIRFTASDGETELDYWMHDDISSGVYAVFWVEVTGDLTAGNVTIYVYYDTAGATATTENMTNTFIVGADDQETAIGAVPVGWVDVSEAGCDARVRNDQFKYGDRSFKFNDVCNPGYARASISGKTLTTYIVVDFYVRILQCDFYACLKTCDGGANQVALYFDHGGDDMSILSPGPIYHKIMTLADNQWYHVQGYIDNVTDKWIGCYVDGVWKPGNWANWGAGLPETVYLLADRSINTTGRMWIDCFFTRKYVSNTQGNDPAHGAWGGEETPTVFTPTNCAASCTSPVTPYAITITWNDNATNETAYYVERDDGGWHVISGALPAATQIYIDNTVVCNTLYLYRVRAYYSGCGGIYSGYCTIGAAVQCVCSIPPPPPPPEEPKLHITDATTEWFYDYDFKYEASEMIKAEVIKYIEETKRIMSKVTSRLFEETKRVKSRLGRESFEETKLIYSPLFTKFTETCPIMGNFIKRFEETQSILSIFLIRFTQHKRIHAETKSVEEEKMDILEIDEREEY